MRKTLIPLLFVLAGCQHDKIETQKTVPVFNKDTGNEIPFEDAQRWMQHFRNTNARVEGTTPSLTAAHLRNLLQISNCMGIAFHYAIDDNGNQHILAIPLDQTLGLFEKDKYIVDATSNTVVTRETAELWAKRYQKTNPNGIWYHRFGINILNEIKSLANFQQFDIEQGLNDKNEKQLILIVWDYGTTNGRTMGKPKSYDMSNPCPCP
jgi:hypothetical protein